MSRRVCVECGQAAVWAWEPEPDANAAIYLCDDHAADKDLDELDELSGSAMVRAPGAGAS